MLFAYLFMCLIYGTTFLAIKLGILAGFSPFLFAAARFGTAGLMIILFLLGKRNSLPSKKEDLINLVYLGICMTFFPFAALFWGEQYISSGLAALLSSFGPIIVLLFSLFLHRKKPSLNQWIGVLAGIGGMLLVVSPQLQIGYSWHWLLGSLAILLSEVAFAWGAVFSKRLLNNGITPLAVNGFQMFFGSIGLLLLAFLFEPFHFPAAASLSAYGSLLYLILFGSLIGSGIYYWLVKRTNPLFPSTWLYVSPVIALAVGFFLLNEPIYPISIAGTVLVIFGVLLTNANEWREMLNLSLRPGKKGTSSAT